MQEDLYLPQMDTDGHRLISYMLLELNRGTIQLRYHALGAIKDTSSARAERMSPALTHYLNEGDII